MSEKSKRIATRRGHAATTHDPNASNCPLCTGKDTVDMVECNKCKKRHHFRCAKFDGSGSLLNWSCQSCDQTSSKSTSSKSSIKTSTNNPTNVQNPPVVQIPTSVENPTNVQNPAIVSTNPTNDQNQQIQTNVQQSTIVPTSTDQLANPQPSTSTQPPVIPPPSISIPSSASSRRRSRLQLEKLAKEKAIKDKLIEEKARLETEYLDKEYDIRENLSDSEDDGPTEQPEKSDFVADWVNTTRSTMLEADQERTAEPESIVRQMGATTEQIIGRMMHEMSVSRQTSSISGLELIPSKMDQFAQPLISDPLGQGNDVNSPPHITSVDESLNIQTTTTSGVLDTSTNVFSSAYRSGTDPPPFIVDLINQQPQMPISARFSSSFTPIPTLNTTVTQQQPAMNQVNQRSSSMPNIIQQQSSVQSTSQQSSSVPSMTQQSTYVPNTAQQSLSVPNMTQQQSSVPNTAQQPVTPNQVYQQNQIHQQSIQQSTPVSVQPQQIRLNSNQPQQIGSNSNQPQQLSSNTIQLQRSIPTTNQHQSTFSTVPQRNTSFVTQQPINVVTSIHQPTPNINFSQPVVINQNSPVSTVQYQQSNINQPSFVTNPTMQQSSYQQYIPSTSYQQPIVTPMVTQQQSTFNFTQQPHFAPNASMNVSGFGHQPISTFGQVNASYANGIGQQLPTNQWVTYDPALNPQQLPPNRLQLAARQTMPKDYPTFNGDPEKWALFRNAYINVTMSCGLSNGENLSRIERCLEDPARRAVKNLLTMPDSVPEIMETLKMLYGRPEASIDAQIKAIKNEPPPKMHKMETFIDFSMSVRNVTSEIEKSGMWQYLWNPQLIQDLLDKLPSQMRMDWGQVKMMTPNVNLSTFSSWLYVKAQTACAVTVPSTEKKNNKPNSNSHVNAHSNGNNNNNSNKKPQNDTSKRSNNSNGKDCRVCNKPSHNTDECRKFLGMTLSDRWEIVKSNKMCHICLGNHHTLRCESKSLCGESGCTIKHHRLLHNSSKPTTTTTTNVIASPSNVHNSNQQGKIVILRRYIPVTLHGPNGSINVIAFLDDGSDTTLIEHWIIQKLGITGEYEDLYLRWTAKIVRKEQNSQSITVKISGTRPNDRQYEIKNARTVKSLNLPIQTVDIDQLRNDFKFLRRIPIESFFNETPKILIGMRDCKLSTPLKSRSGSWDEPIATKTRLGWEVHGANAPSAQIANLNFHSTDNNDDDNNLHQLVAQFFSLDNFGVKKPEQTVEALSDKRARELLESTTKRIGKRFETGLLWKYDDISLPNSFPMAQRRLESLEKRLEKDPELALLFRTKFNEYVEKGYVRKLHTEELSETNKKTWYLPLFPVTYSKKPGKIRLVWDAAAKVGNISLNSMLLSGPDLLVSLPGVLYRFREGRFVVTGDIREMFHQIAVRVEDQPSQRFLWREKGSSKIEVYTLLVLSFGATSSPSSAQHVKNKNAIQFIEEYPRAEEAIRKNTYVDDWLQSFDTEMEAETVANEVKYVHSEGGFEIRNWLSNSPQVSRNLGASSEDEQKLSFDTEESKQERILGMWWQVKQDAFTYSLRYNPLNKDILFNNRRPTKREALRTLMTIFDPIGFLAHFLVQLKMIIQDIWRTGIAWDEQIKRQDDDDLYIRWLNWIKHLPDIERISINRHYSDKIHALNRTKIELHIFVDASELAYATVAYFRIEDQDGVELSLIGGKTKVAPLKPLSVPRMELQAAVLGARFKNSIIENHTLNVTRKFIWSDSATVLSWLKSDLRRYTQYVGARVGEILETTSLPEWRWIPSKLNPADDATKYKNSFSLDMNNRWFTGPDFLLQSEEFWPKKPTVETETEEELRPRYVHVHTKIDKENFSIKFGTVIQWKRTMAFVFRFINNVKAKLKKPGFQTRNGLLTRKEFQEGENALYRMAQWDEFAQDILKLQQGEKDTKGRRVSVDKSSPIYQYSPYLDHAGVLRMRGRIDAIYNVSYDQKRPIILPTSNQITDLVVTEYHVLYKHQNTETVVNEIKQRFVIPRMRALLKRIRRTCQHCKNLAAQPHPPEMARLPAARLASFTRPFTFVGVDYAGPYKIIQFRRTVKRWIVVYTCLTIRGVYLDVVESLTTDSCIQSITRFIARNGIVREFFSDNGTSFVGANNELQREIAKLDQNLINATFTSCYTQWNFNPPYGQHMGGAWERLIRSMKTTLDEILPKSHYPDHETFVTALAEVENIINSRPLTFVSIEPDDNEALTPNHFIKGSSNGYKPPGIFPPLPKTLRGNWRYAQQIANEFWNRWVKEYLPMITRRTKWFDDVKPIEVGDQVIIVDEDTPRNTWERGVIVEAEKTGPDGRISRAKVRTVNGIYTRPVTKLAVLDLVGPEAKAPTRESLAGGSVTASSDT